MGRVQKRSSHENPLIALRFSSRAFRKQFKKFFKKMLNKEQKESFKESAEKLRK